ncbi:MULTISPECIES: hypothetical protein [unclassified Clostridioides]|uniref:hypothetical protein n=1 Tax=unclassified Clostridioides TaxID=2635829 RepID=UPI001D0BFD68|nr:hypothetical protein [Clostridioides sp. ES-S-0001-02]MCC0652342.1 hypothetical protein [Clostridioides sp. ES-S-0001-03]MCC0655013.1 hypothetical protein [Clostridioides sp. ES-S-0123-01]MCC0673571.1 hypothetical protein [Clostridioides sp. ES-S-0145-01]MCC0679832.1 hypothetical protein [Clostridioides sp. ES-S-0005-03]MCC0695040.1 hypothetical protein [Clostridioides sp. ES-S-0048-02]MCC0709017.1 hypothetical protein [Clostridioides sp. ES-S-0190-01]UDN46071.1 hypothetical protein JJJ25
MGVLKVMFYVFLFLDLVSIFCFFFNKGKIASNTIVFNAIGVYTFVLCFMYFSSYPSNNILGKFIASLFFILGVAGVMLKEKNFLYARLLLTLVIVCSTLKLFVI